MSSQIPLCNSTDLADSGEAVPFDVVYGGQTCRAFAIRFEGQVHAYLNRCGHVAMEMDAGCCVPRTAPPTGRTTAPAPAAHVAAA
jgi:nitrite reductase/ring-hydroxylating ferredoxin subunit